MDRIQLIKNVSHRGHLNTGILSYLTGQTKVQSVRLAISLIAHLRIKKVNMISIKMDNNEK